MELAQLQSEHTTVLERLAGTQRLLAANDASLDEWRRAWRELWELEARQQQQQLAAAAAKAQAKIELLERARDEDARRHREEGAAAAREAAHAAASEAARAAWGHEEQLSQELHACREEAEAARLEAARAATRAAAAEARVAGARDEAEARWRPGHDALVEEASALERQVARMNVEHEAARGAWQQLMDASHAQHERTLAERRAQHESALADARAQLEATLAELAELRTRQANDGEDAARWRASQLGAGAADEERERERQARLEALGAKSVRRLLRQGLLRAWGAWTLLAEAAAHRSRLLRTAHGRLMRPRLLAGFGAWREDWRHASDAEGAYWRERVLERGAHAHVLNAALADADASIAAREREHACEHTAAQQRLEAAAREHAALGTALEAAAAERDAALVRAARERDESQRELAAAQQAAEAQRQERREVLEVLQAEVARTLSRLEAAEGHLGRTAEQLESTGAQRLALAQQRQLGYLERGWEQLQRRLSEAVMPATEGSWTLSAQVATELVRARRSLDEIVALLREERALREEQTRLLEGARGPSVAPEVAQLAERVAEALRAEL